LKISSEDRDSQVQNQPLKTEIKSEDFIFVHLVTILKVDPNSSKYNTKFICSQFCACKFWHAWWDDLYLSSLSLKSRLPSPNNIFFKKPWLPKILPLKLRRRTLDLSLEDLAKLAPFQKTGA